MIKTLSPYQLRKARDLYNIFNVFNALSWQFLIGNIITLFALRIEATSTYIGIISALLYMSYFFLSLGKLMAKKFSIIGVFSIGWLFRSIGMFPLVLVPFIYSAGHQKTALLLTVLGVSIFHIFRGIGMIGNNPVLSYLSSGPDRGAYMTQTQIINSAMGMFGGFIIAMILGRNPPLFLYSIIFAAGIGTGIVSGILIRKTPEPPTEKGEKAMKFFDILKEAVSKPSIRRFVVIFLLTALTSGVARTFIIVYAREVFHQSDGMVSLYAVFGSLGNLMIGLLIKFFVDRIGAKPIFIVCVLTGLISMIPIVFFPRAAVDNFTTVTLFLTFVFFIINFGFLGAENIGQTYFLGLIPVELMMDMGILYFFVFGVAGAGGSFLGGLFLDTLGAFGLTPFMSFKLLFIILIAISALVLFLQRKLIPMGALPFIGALEVMFSFRDLKAISLLDRLNKTSDSEEEEAILEALHDTPSKLSIKGLLHRARSPRLTVRTESLHALEALEILGEDAERALMNDIINNPYTTAYISARILGSHGVFSAIPLLRELTSSRDYMLAGEAMIALAKLGDHAFRPHIEAIIAKTRNPRLKIMGVEAFGIYGSPNSLSILLDILRSADPPPYLRDEVVLAMASILDIQNQFYPILVRFLEDESQVWTLAKDEAESAFEYYRSIHGNKKNTGKAAKFARIREQVKNFLPAIFAFINDSNGALLSRWILEIPDELTQTISQMILSETVLDDELMGHRRLKLLIAHWVSHELRFWTNRLK